MGTKRKTAKEKPLTEKRVRELIAEEMAKVFVGTIQEPSIPTVACYYMAVPVMHDPKPQEEVGGAIVTFTFEPPVKKGK